MRSRSRALSRHSRDPRNGPLGPAVRGGNPEQARPPRLPPDPRFRGDDKQGRPFAVELRHIDKRFGAVHANRDVSLSIAAGSVTGIVGENGAGKSTLMSILYGFYEADSGEILIDGKPVLIARPA